ncbi:MAG: hypothetical protein J6P13_05980, partial [Kiritimatiellae bacterium]|nr:hypothetical protein [Kiritimatiellia bacterium]
HAASVRSEPESNSQKKKVLSFVVLAPHKHLFVFRVPSGGSSLRLGNLEEPIGTRLKLLNQRSIAFALAALSVRFKPFQANGCILYHISPSPRKGVF